jgi:enoyl-CoA hydratase/carnithine racemase
VSYATLRLERPRAGVALITLDRPGRLNAMTFEMFDELHAVCAELTAAADDVRCVVITGAGRGFCSGLDLDEAARLPDMTAQEMMLGQERWAGALIAIHELPQPVIAAVNGPAAGGGLGLALAADIRLAAPAARFNAAFVRIGLTAGDVGVSWSLPRVLGFGVAAELMFTGRFVDADEAARIGLVNRVVEGADLLDEAYAMAEQIAANSPFGVMLTKRVLHANVDAPGLRSAVEMENRGQTLATRGDDFREALSAFRERRPAVFSGA